MIKMAQLEHIKKMYHLEGQSIREISRKTGHHRDTIAKYLNNEDSEPPRYNRCLKKIQSFTKVLESGREAIAFPKAYVKDPQAAVAQYSYLFNEDKHSPRFYTSLTN